MYSLWFRVGKNSGRRSRRPPFARPISQQRRSLRQCGGVYQIRSRDAVRPIASPVLYPGMLGLHSRSHSWQYNKSLHNFINNIPFYCSKSFSLGSACGPLDTEQLQYIPVDLCELGAAFVVFWCILWNQPQPGSASLQTFGTLLCTVSFHSG